MRNKKNLSLLVIALLVVTIYRPSISFGKNDIFGGHTSTLPGPNDYAVIVGGSYEDFLPDVITTYFVEWVLTNVFDVPRNHIFARCNHYVFR